MNSEDRLDRSQNQNFHRNRNQSQSQNDNQQGFNRGHDQGYTRPGRSNWKSGTHRHSPPRGPAQSYPRPRSRSPSHPRRGFEPPTSPRAHYTHSPSDKRLRAERDRKSPYEPESRPRSGSDAGSAGGIPVKPRGMWRREFGMGYSHVRDHEDRYDRQHSSGASGGAYHYDRARGRGRGRGRGGWRSRTRSRSRSRSRSPAIAPSPEDGQGKRKEREEREAVNEVLPSSTQTLITGQSDVKPRQSSSTSPSSFWHNTSIDDLYAGLSDDGLMTGVPPSNPIPSGSGLHEDNSNGLANEGSRGVDEADDPSRSDDSGEMSVELLDLTYPSEPVTVSGPQSTSNPQLYSQSSEPTLAIQSSSKSMSESTSLPVPMSTTPHKTEKGPEPITSIGGGGLERSQSDSAQISSETVTIPMKRERSVSPLSSLSMTRSLVTTGVKRYAPLPPSCVSGRADFKNARREWSLKMMSEINALGLQCTKTIIRDDGMAIEWTSLVPVWSDTLLPPSLDTTGLSNIQRKKLHAHAMPKVKPDISVANVSVPVASGSNAVSTDLYRSQASVSSPVRDAYVTQESNLLSNSGIDDRVTEGSGAVPMKSERVGVSAGGQFDVPNSALRGEAPLKAESQISPLDQPKNNTPPLVQEVNSLRITPSRNSDLPEEQEMPMSARKMEKQRSKDPSDQPINRFRSLSTPGSGAPSYSNHSSDPSSGTSSESVHHPTPVNISADQEERLYQLAFNFMDRYVLAFNDNRDALIHAYSKDVVFSCQVHEIVCYGELQGCFLSAGTLHPFLRGLPTNNCRKNRTNNIKTSPADIVTFHSGLGEHRYERREETGSIDVTYDMYVLSGPAPPRVLLLFRAPCGVSSRKHRVLIENSLVLQERETSTELQDAELWPLVANCHQMIVRDISQAEI